MRLPTSPAGAVPQWLVTCLALLASAAPAAALAASATAPAGGSPQEPSLAIFFGQIVALIVCGRLIGELMERIGQPAVMGQLIGGMLLGPSVFGSLFPTLQHALFPAAAGQKAMLDAVSQLGILLLLLLTGMETDLSVIRSCRRTAVSVSFAGIAIPFACGVLLGEWLPAALLPDPNKRLITALFLGTALSISSVKIVALLVRELGFLRRTVGQVIVASAIIDDTVGWIIMSVIFGLALHGGIDFMSVTRSVAGTALFLVLSFTVGRRIVFFLIRWANDRFVTELPAITMIIVVAGLMALATDAIGVHTVLGAFVAGILVGQSPILTRHIEEQLRGLIVALFMPVFFGMAGLSANLHALTSMNMLLLTIGLIVIASIGKFSGAVLGGRIGGLTLAESLAVGSGMNARGSTEVIIASFGLAMGALSQNLFTAIVTMAVVTTMVMPPMLRWSVARLPIRAEEQERLEREDLEERGFVSQLERLLVAVDSSSSGQLASRLVGLLAGVRQIPTTALHFDYATAQALPGTEQQVERTATVLTLAAESGGEASDPPGEPDPPKHNIDITVRVEEAGATEAAIGEEAKKGYGLMFIGREPASEGNKFTEHITRSAVSFGGPIAIVIARDERDNSLGDPIHDDEDPDDEGPVGERPGETRSRPLNILVPVTGTPISRQGAELAVALAQGSRGSVTALHVAGPSSRERPRWGVRLSTALAPDSSADATIQEVIELGKAYGVEVKGTIRSRRTAENAIIREIRGGNYDLLVMGVSPRPGDQLFFGEVPADLLERSPCSLVFVASEPAAPSYTTAS
jgi:Kef-type K+ transport system membrane component KefB/nucleotide-binding universal stress UspA family protein